MSDTSTQLSGAALNRALAEVLGWTALEADTAWYETPDNTWEQNILSGIPPDGKYQRIVPDWSGDTGAAYALCLDVLDRLNASDPQQMWVIEIGLEGVSFVLTAYGGGIWDSIGQDGRGAESLARLALAALRAGER